MVSKTKSPLSVRFSGLWNFVFAASSAPHTRLRVMRVMRVVVMALDDHESIKLREPLTSVNSENSIGAIGFPDDHGR